MGIERVDIVHVCNRTKWCVCAGCGVRGWRGRCREDLTELTPAGFSMANKLFLVLKCTPHVGSHRCCLVSSSPQGLRAHYLDKAWICTAGEVAGLSLTVCLVVL